MNIRSMAWISEEELTKPDTTVSEGHNYIYNFPRPSYSQSNFRYSNNKYFVSQGATRRNKLSAISDVISPFNARLLALR